MRNHNEELTIDLRQWINVEFKVDRRENIILGRAVADLRNALRLLLVGGFVSGSRGGGTTGWGARFSGRCEPGSSRLARCIGTTSLGSQWAARIVVDIVVGARPGLDTCKTIGESLASCDGSSGHTFLFALCDLSFANVFGIELLVAAVDFLQAVLLGLFRVARFDKGGTEGQFRAVEFRNLGITFSNGCFVPGCNGLLPAAVKLYAFVDKPLVVVGSLAAEFLF